jgi:hypothetical protein
LLKGEGNSNQIAVEEDHSKMVKFRSRADPNYQRVFAKIKEMLENYEANLLETSFTPMEITYEMCEVQERLQGSSTESSDRASN